MIDLNKDIADTALVTPITRIRLLEEMDVECNCTALRLRRKAELKVQVGRLDRCYDITADKAVKLLNEGAAEVAEAIVAEDTVDLADGSRSEAEVAQTVLEVILRMARDTSRPPSQRVSIIEEFVADALAEAKETA